MSNYTKTTNFAAKDALTPGDPNKKIYGTAHDTEYNNIATAVASKEDANNKGAVNGYASLDSSTKVPDAQVSLTSVSQHQASLTTRNVTGKTGTAKTLSTSDPSDGADGDIWYKY